jgi:rubredoxin
MSNYNCKRCGFISSTKQNLQSHLKKKKICESILEDIDRDDLLNELSIREKKEKKEKKCKKCSKIFNTRQAKWAHEQNCIINNDIKLDITEKNEIKELRNEILELKNLFLQSSKQIINNTVNNTVNNTNNTNTIIINNLRPFGQENYDFIKLKDISNELNYSKKLLMKLFQKIHFNINHPENWNFYISNKGNNECNIFTGKKFESKDKNKSIEALLNNNIKFLEYFINTLDELKENEKEFIIDGIKNYININDRLKDKNYKYDINELINYISDLAYNRREKIENVRKEMDKKNKIESSNTEIIVI